MMRSSSDYCRLLLLLVLLAAVWINPGAWCLSVEVTSSASPDSKQRGIEKTVAWSEVLKGIEQLNDVVAQIQAVGTDDDDDELMLVDDQVAELLMKRQLDTKVPERPTLRGSPPPSDPPEMYYNEDDANGDDDWTPPHTDPHEILYDDDAPSSYYHDDAYYHEDEEFCQICGHGYYVGNPSALVEIKYKDDVRVLPCEGLQDFVGTIMYDSEEDPEFWCEYMSELAWDACECTSNAPTSHGGYPPSAPTTTGPDQCDEAIPVTHLPFVVGGVLSRGNDFDSASNVCGIRAPHSQVWLSYVTTTTPLALNVTAGRIPAVIAIMEGVEDGCGFLRCLGYQYGSEYEYAQQNPVSYTWIAKPNVRYYILLSGMESHFNYNYEPLPFELQVFDYPTPENDECTGAKLIDGLPFSDQDSTVGSMTDFGLNACGIRGSSRGVWYKMVGGGKVTKLRAIAAEHSLRVAIFEGDSCDFLSCVSEKFDFQIPNLVQGYGMEMEFHARSDTNYSILISGYDEHAVGPFELDVTEYPSPENDNCADAALIDSLPYTAQGSTVGSTSDYEVAHYCAGSVPSYVGGVWYKVVANGKVLRATMQQLQPSRHDYRLNLHLSVFTGDSCAFLECVEATVEYPLDHNGYQRDDAKTQRWIGGNDLTYWIHVSSNDFSSVGSFRLTVQEVEPPVNDDCEDAVVIPMTSLPFKTQGTTVGSLSDSPFQMCGIQAGSRGVWYKLEGNGKQTSLNLVEINAPNSYSRSQNRLITVFTATAAASCDFLECDSFNRHTAPPFLQHFDTWSTYTWFAQSGITYYILVGNQEATTSVGAFNLQVSQIEPPPNENCDSARNIGSMPYLGNGTTYGAGLDFEFPTCGMDPRKSVSSVWHSFVGSGKVVQIALLFAQQSQMTLSVFSAAGLSDAPCGNVDLLDCTAFVSSDESHQTPPFDLTLDVQTDEGLTYYIMLTTHINYYGSHYGVHDSGEYQMRVSEYPTPANDKCEAAAAIPGTPFVHVGESSGALTNSIIVPTPTSAGEQECGTAHPPYDNGYIYEDDEHVYYDDERYNTATQPRRGVWYLFTGAGRPVTASVVTGGDFYNAVISVFAGASCDSLMCVADQAQLGFTHTTNMASYTWTAQQFQTYLIHIWGFEGHDDAGRYQFKLMDHGRIPTAASMLFQDYP